MAALDGYGTVTTMDCEAPKVRLVPPCASSAANARRLTAWVPEGKRTEAEVGEVGPETNGTSTGGRPGTWTSYPPPVLFTALSRFAAHESVTERAHALSPASHV
jgi:hypothetical protein